jgi:hypothetical protein
MGRAAALPRRGSAPTGTRTLSIASRESYRLPTLAVTDARATTLKSEDTGSEAVRLNTEARLQALKVSPFTLAGLAPLAYFPAGAWPGQSSSEAPAEPLNAGGFHGLLSPDALEVTGCYGREPSDD